MKQFPKLFKLTSTGKIQEWEIWAEENIIHKRHGQQDGKKQHTTDVISEGKNIGRSNETTPEGQAIFEANALWNKKREKDYRESIKDLTKEKTSSFGGFLPMLAHEYNKHKDKMIFPCYVQPKLDGIRCISKCENGKVTLWFRSGKQITTMNHIVKELENIMKDGDLLDGELYIHNADFNKIGGSIRRDKNMKIEEAEKIEYHIYDFPRIRGLIEKNTFKERFENIIISAFTTADEHIKCLKMVRTHEVDNFEQAMKIYKIFVKDKYEGIMFRNINSPYEQKRSYNLLKYKEFNEEEFKIVGFEEGRGLLAGSVGAFICELNNGETFKAKLKGKNVTKLLKEYFKNPDIFMGKYLTVKYQGLSKDNVPRFPVGKIIRFDK